MSGSLDEKVWRLEETIKKLEAARQVADEVVPAMKRVPPVWRDSSAIATHISGVLSLALSWFTAVNGDDLGLGAYVSPVSALLALLAPVAYLLYGYSRGLRQEAVTKAQGLYFAAAVACWPCWHRWPT